jgi:queuine tRNA-ribosyltransferase
MSIQFQVTHTDGAARYGLMRTLHGDVETPVFMPVGTQAAVKGLTPHMLEEAGARFVLGNTYHLTLRPGDELIAQLGGLHRFMNWPGPILTDSGGFQIYSLAQSRKIDDRAAVFRSHIDGALLELTPERAVAIQENLGADIAMCLDECPPLGEMEDGGDEDRRVKPGGSPGAKHRRPPDDGSLREAVRRTILWAERCKAAQRRADQSLFAIVQGGLDVSLRAECARALIALDFPGYALGGFSVGETPEQMAAVLGECAALLPAHKPRYLMGVGRPEDILHAIGCGLDMFDCVLPTRNGRNAQALTYDGAVRLRNACHKRDSAPLESDCACYTCRHFSRAYLHHLFLAEEMLGPTLASLHNVAFYCRLTADARQAIREGRFAQFRAVCLARWGSAV